MATKEKAPDDACQAKTGTEEHQNPERTPGATVAAKNALAKEAAEAVEAEAKGE